MTLALRGQAAAAAPAGPRIAGFARAHALALILVLALGLRLALLLTPRSYFPDEIFQYLEPAHRLAFGPGVVPWEYRTGIRSWLVPLLLAGPMAAGDWAAPGTGAYLLLPKLLVVLVSLGTIVAAAMLGNRISPRHGLFAAFATTIWSETALFGTQALTEALAVPFVLLGAAALDGAGTRDTRRLVAGGALLAFGIVLRFQYGPAVALLGAMACGREPRRWALAAAGGCAVLAVTGCVDMAMGQRPFGWIVENFHQNIGLKRSHAWTDGPFFYPLMIAAAFGVTLLPAWALARRVVPRYPALAACALANVAVHTLIAHKEYRYILLSTTILVVLAAIGTADALDRVRTRRRTWLAVAIAGWIAGSLLTVATGFPARAWSRITPQLEAFAALRETPRLCGLAIAGDYWADTGGYAYLHRAVPLYIPDDNDAAPRSWIPQSAAGFNAIMAPATLASSLPAAYRRAACFGDGRACLFERAGGCDPHAASDHEINRVLVRLDR